MEIDTPDPAANVRGLAAKIALAEPTQSSSSTTRVAQLHRLRFVDYNPSNITSLALTPTTYDPSIHYPYVKPFNEKSAAGREILAVGRQNGDIEIYVWIGGVGEPRRGGFAGKGKAKENQQGWVLERTLAAPHPSRVEHLLFTHQVILSEQDKDLFDPPEQVRELKKLRSERPRLFSAGGGSDLWEWDWADGGLGYVKRALPSQGGAIWSIASNPDNTMLALGCDDGAVRLVSLWDGELELVRKFDSTKTKILSLSWGPMSTGPNVKARYSQAEKQAKALERALAEEQADGDENADDSNDEGGDENADEEKAAILAVTRRKPKYFDDMLVTGCADSTVRVWDVKTGRCTYRMTTDKIKGEQTLVWCVGVLKDRTIVSGDSMGVVKFWDGVKGTQIQSNRAHRADVLCLAIGADGKSVYTSGVDQKVIQFQHMRVSGPKKQRTDRWVVTNGRRMHQHDVRAIIVSPTYNLGSSEAPAPTRLPHIPVVISGGLDFQVNLTAAATAAEATTNKNPVAPNTPITFNESFNKKMPYIKMRNRPTGFAREAQLIICRREKSVDVWEVGKEKEWEKVLEMDLKARTNLIASAISPDGSYIAVSDLYETKVFRLRRGSDGLYRAKRSEAVMDALAEHPQVSSDMGASEITFTHDSSKLILATALGCRVVVVGLPESKQDQATVLRVFSQHRVSNMTVTGRALAGRGQTATQKQPNGTQAASGAKTDGSDSNEEDSEEENEDEDEHEDENRENSDASDGEKQQASTIVSLATSCDGQWLVSADAARRLHVFNLDSLQYHAALPSPELPPVCMAFSPTSPAAVCLALPNNTLVFFDVESRTVPTWAERLMYRGIFDAERETTPIIGMCYDTQPTSRELDVLIIHGATWVIKVPVSKIPPRRREVDATAADATLADTTLTDATPVNGTKRRADEEDKPVREGPRFDTSITSTHRYQPILMVDFTSQGEMILAERPYFNMLGQMAPSFTPHKYGRN